MTTIVIYSEIYAFASLDIVFGRFLSQEEVIYSTVQYSTVEYWSLTK